MSERAQALESAIAAVLHQMEHGEASDFHGLAGTACELDLRWCMRTLRAALVVSPCVTCDGTGIGEGAQDDPDSQMVQCGDCGGTGVQAPAEGVSPQPDRMIERCPECDCRMIHSYTCSRLPVSPVEPTPAASHRTTELELNALVAQLQADLAEARQR